MTFLEDIRMAKLDSFYLEGRNAVRVTLQLPRQKLTEQEELEIWFVRDGRNIDYVRPPCFMMVLTHITGPDTSIVPGCVCAKDLLDRNLTILAPIRSLLSKYHACYATVFKYADSGFEWRRRRMKAHGFVHLSDAEAELLTNAIEQWKTKR